MNHIGPEHTHAEDIHDTHTHTHTQSNNYTTELEPNPVLLYFTLLSSPLLYFAEREDEEKRREGREGRLIPKVKRGGARRSEEE